jgi:hypothetical protein
MTTKRLGTAAASSKKVEFRQDWTWLWTLRFRSNEPHLDRKDRELKVEQLKWPLYVLDEVIVATFAGSSQFIRASGF